MRTDSFKAPPPGGERTRALVQAVPRQPTAGVLSLHQLQGGSRKTEWIQAGAPTPGTECRQLPPATLAGASDSSPSSGPASLGAPHLPTLFTDLPLALPQGSHSLLPGLSASTQAPSSQPPSYSQANPFPARRVLLCLWAFAHARPSDFCMAGSFWFIRLSSNANTSRTQRLPPWLPAPLTLHCCLFMACTTI